MENAIYSQTLLAGVVKRHPMPMEQVKAAAKEVLSLIKEGLVRDGSVRVQNFGTFKLKYVAEHKGRNPQTGEIITIKAQNRIIFTPAKALRELIEPHRAKATPIANNKVTKLPTNKTATQNEIKPTIKSAALLSSTVAVSTTTPKPAEPFQPESKNGKVILAGAAVVLLAIVLVYLLQDDQQISTQVTISNQPAEIPETTFETVTEQQTEIKEIPANTEQEDIPKVAQNESIAPVEETTTTTTSSTEITTTEQESVTALPEQNTQAAEQTNTPFFLERKYRLVRGDSLWRLADKNYGNALLWTHIFQANHDSIKNPDKLRERRQIMLPTLQGNANALTKEDRYHIAEGYYLAYLHYKSIGDKDSFFALLEAKRYSPELVKEKMDGLKLSQLERLLLKHQPVYR